MARQPLDHNKLAQEKRDTARRARRLARALVTEADRARLTRFAEELDAEADALERAPVAISVPPVPAPNQQVQQQQVQQQQSAAAGSDVTKEKKD
jgi:hypothetical protein